MERETPGQRPQPNYGHPQALNESTQEWLLLDIADASDPRRLQRHAQGSSLGAACAVTPKDPATRDPLARQRSARGQALL